MKFVVDDKIPFIRPAIEEITSEVRYIPGADICPDDVRDADALIVRTRTQCGERLLAGSRVSFVATATIGVDHLDTKWLDKAGIRWINCPGSNASSVAQYVSSVLALLPRGGRVGVIGCGHIGSMVKRVAEMMGFSVLVNDPPLEKEGKSDAHFVSLDTICSSSDIITFHVPLTADGPFPTYHLADRSFFDSLAGKVIINTSRGGIVDEEALIDAIDKGKVGAAVIDTWEGEPLINRRLLDKVWIATPHIAGYSADGKVNADNMVIDALTRFFHIPRPKSITAPDSSKEWNILDDDNRLRRHPESFERLRDNYPLRRERWRKDFLIG